MNTTSKSTRLFEDIHSRLDSFMSTLLIVNNDKIVINKEVLLKVPRYDDDHESHTISYAPYWIAEIRYEEGRILVCQHPDGESVEFGRFDLFEKERLICAATEAAKKEPLSESFPITSVSRADLDYKGYDTKKITDENMKALAKKMSDTYLEGSFWIDLDYLADHLGFPKK